jgi:hypothetical protein
MLEEPLDPPELVPIEITFEELLGATKCPTNTLEVPTLPVLVPRKILEGPAAAPELFPIVITSLAFVVFTPA